MVSSKSYSRQSYALWPCYFPYLFPLKCCIPLSSLPLSAPFTWEKRDPPIKVILHKWSTSSSLQSLSCHCGKCRTCNLWDHWCFIMLQQDLHALDYSMRHEGKPSNATFTISTCAANLRGSLNLCTWSSILPRAPLFMGVCLVDDMPTS